MKGEGFFLLAFRFTGGVASFRHKGRLGGNAIRDRNTTRAGQTAERRLHCFLFFKANRHEVD